MKQFDLLNNSKKKATNSQAEPKDKNNINRVFKVRTGKPMLPRSKPATPALVIHKKEVRNS